MFRIPLVHTIVKALDTGLVICTNNRYLSNNNCFLPIANHICRPCRSVFYVFIFKNQSFFRHLYHEYFEYQTEKTKRGLTDTQISDIIYVVSIR